MPHTPAPDAPPVPCPAHHTVPMAQAATQGQATPQAQLWALLQRQAELFALGHSSSLPQETVAELLESILFCIGMAPAGNVPLAQQFAAGQQALQQKLALARRWQRVAAATLPTYANLSLRDTVSGIAPFFTHYNPRFFAHRIPCDIDYPLCCPPPAGQQGVLYLCSYLSALLLETRFCQKLNSRLAAQLLLTWQPQYRVLHLNICQPLITSVAGLALAGADVRPLLHTSQTLERIFTLVQASSPAALQALLAKAAASACNQLEIWDDELRAYVQGSLLALPPVLKATRRDALHHLFPVL